MHAVVLIDLDPFAVELLFHHVLLVSKMLQLH